MAWNYEKIRKDLGPNASDKDVQKAINLVGSTDRFRREYSTSHKTSNYSKKYERNKYRDNDNDRTVKTVDNKQYNKSQQDPQKTVTTSNILNGQNYSSSANMGQIMQMGLGFALLYSIVSIFKG